ncbi:hypothetical protein [Corynebacterium gerontici]|uniref:Uncharacterized protein n=1 Tax=Corynebacterium gerontici TaxID=2079234 RepID=A0A3G6J1U4_9CORY|nr:hypothetical protein [Corynebacterium gerontici]AZA11987.1 hypothetical protein CGERO_08475 [Corynebacterium gerontici]
MSISRVFDAYLSNSDVPAVESTFGELHFEYACEAVAEGRAAEALARAVDIAAAELGSSDSDCWQERSREPARWLRPPGEHADGGEK